MGYSVGEVARLAGVTVRTLHHYDESRLLEPSGRSDAGYRRYDDTDLERLQRILFYRELGFTLEDIATILDDPEVDPLEHLRDQHRLLTERIEQLQRMVAAVETAMEARQMGISLTPEEMFEVFGDHDPTQYAEEAEERWGGSDAYRDSMRRAASYTKDDWLRMQEESGATVHALVDLMASGAEPTSTEAMELAEQHRQHITRWFYDCSYEIHRGLGDMYVQDQRFTDNYDQHAPGLARFLHDAIHANAERAGA